MMVGRKLLYQATLITLMALLTACEDSSINIPNRTGIGIPDTVLDIHSPINNSTLPVNTPFILEYVIINSEQGDYLKVQVDKQKPVLVVGQKGQHYMQGLPVGIHHLKITAYRDKIPSGGLAIVTLKVQ